MASNINPELQSETKQGPKPDDLDMIANFMDGILKNMKTHIQNIKNKNNDNTSISSDLRNLINATQKDMISDFQKPSKIEATTKNKNTKKITNSEPPKRKLSIQKSIDKPERKRLQSPIKSTLNKFDKKPVTAKSEVKPNNVQNKNIKQNSNIGPPKRTASPRKMQVVYRENDKFVSRSLTTMLKQTNQPKITTVPPSLKERPKTNHCIRRPKRSRSPSIVGHTSINRINSNLTRATTKSATYNHSSANFNHSSATHNHSPAPYNHSSRSRSIGKKINITNQPLQTTTNRSTRSRSISSNISRYTSGSQKHSLLKNQENKIPPLFGPPKEVMEKNINRSSKTLRPMSANLSRASAAARSILNNTRTTSLNSKTFRPKSPGTQRHQKDTKRRSQDQQNTKSSAIKEPQNTKQIDIINRINFQNERKIKESIKPNLEIKATTTFSSKPQTPLSSMVENVRSVSKVSSPKPITPIKFMKNTENVKLQHTQSTTKTENKEMETKETEKKETEKKETEKEETENKVTEKKETENKEIEKNETEQNVTNSENKENVGNIFIKKYEMGDNSGKQINEKIQDIIDKIKEEKDLHYQSKSNTPNSRNSERSQNKTPSNESNRKAIVPFKPILNVNNNNNNISNKHASNKISIGKSIVQPTFQKFNFSNHQKTSTPNLKNLPFLLKKSSRQSIQSCIVPKVANMPYLAPNRKLSILSPVEVVQDYVSLVNRAKRDRKTFTVCGNYYSIRRAFIERGWVEKLRISLTDDREAWRKLENLSNFELVEGMKNKDSGDKYRRIFISKLLAGHQVDFYWDYMTNPFSINNDKIKKTLINRLPFGASRSYTSKAGLCESLKEAYWYYCEGSSNILFPRTYNLAIEEEVHSFTEDFRRTAIVSLLQWVAKRADKPSSIISPVGQVPTSVFNFATVQCYNFLKIKEHKDLDETIPMAREYEWDIFLEKFYKIVHFGNHFKETDSITAPLLIDQSRYILNKLRKYIPHIESDGNMNLWLLKPNNGSRGCGIHVCRTLKYTLDTISNRKETKYVIQKYLERPLLIHNTKFDIRQWFLVACMPNLHVWLYKDCYLRFSSQMFDLSKLHESIHLTNNSVQCRYKNNTHRSNALPDQNMWHSDTFRRYLTDIGQPYAWRNCIYKGIKECLVGLFMLCQDKLITRVNSFELCGADFMIMEDFHPYLIEINSRPALYPSTRITAQMCPRVLEDVVKVTIDYARNPRASTGNFELIYKDSFNYTPPKNISTLFIDGMSYLKFASGKPPTPISDPTDSVAVKGTSDNIGNQIQQVLKIDPNKVRKDVKNTLEKILAVIQTGQSTPSELTSDEKNKQFRMMLSEFVDIISTVKNKNDMQ